ncbi:lytic transglycosylase domain-containing protein [bacterium]|nr:lytic transglycosylase domain-containing protein [bacterium]
MYYGYLDYNFDNWIMPQYNFSFATPSFVNIPKPPKFNYAMPNFSAATIDDNNFFNFLNYNNSSIKVDKNESTSEVKGQRTVRQERRAALKVAKHGDGLGPEFLAKVKQVAKNLNCNYKDLLAIMNSESGLNSKAVNKSTNATGLIQFMPATARELGTTVDAIKQMSPIEQLDLVEKYFVRMKQIAGIKPNQKLSGGDLYALVFLPGRANRETLTSSGEKYYSYNKGLDSNNDGAITKTELSRRVARKSIDESIFA